MTVMIDVKGLDKEFGGVHAIEGLEFSVEQGQIYSVIGPNGAGKTTLFNLITGFYTPTRGEITLNGESVVGMDPNRLAERGMCRTFQQMQVCMNMTALENVMLGRHLKIRSNLFTSMFRLPSLLREEKACRERSKELMEFVGCGEYINTEASAMSYGALKRLEIARALAADPKILLLDEPLGALDRKLREQTQFELVNLQERLGITFIVVTHDQEEAMTMSSRIALMREGRIEQVDSPRRMYEFPQSRYAAGFIGNVNLFEGTVSSQDGDQVWVDSDEAGGRLCVRHSQPMTVGMPVTVAVRPEKIRMAQAGDDLPNQMQGVIREIAYLGDESIYHVELASGKRVKYTQPNVQALAELPLTWGQTIALGWHADRCGLLAQ